MFLVKSVGNNISPNTKTILNYTGCPIFPGTTEPNTLYITAFLKSTLLNVHWRYN